MTTGNKNPLLFPLEKGDCIMLPLVRGERFAEQISLPCRSNAKVGGVYPVKISWSSHSFLFVSFDAKISVVLLVATTRPGGMQWRRKS
jgi:hypothetical protein